MKCGCPRRGRWCAPTSNAPRALGEAVVLELHVHVQVTDFAERLAQALLRGLEQVPPLMMRGEQRAGGVRQPGGCALRERATISIDVHALHAAALPGALCGTRIDRHMARGAFRLACGGLITSARSAQSASGRILCPGSKGSCGRGTWHAASQLPCCLVAVANPCIAALAGVCGRGSRGREGSSVVFCARACDGGGRMGSLYRMRPSGAPGARLNAGRPGAKRQSRSCKDSLDRGCLQSGGGAQAQQRTSIQHMRVPCVNVAGPLALHFGASGRGAPSTERRGGRAAGERSTRTSAPEREHIATHVRMPADWCAHISSAARKGETNSRRKWGQR